MLQPQPKGHGPSLEAGKLREGSPIRHLGHVVYVAACHLQSRSRASLHRQSDIDILTVRERVFPQQRTHPHPPLCKAQHVDHQLVYAHLFPLGAPRAHMARLRAMV